MSIHNEKSLKQVLAEMQKVYKLKPKLNQTQLQAEWETIMGKVIAKYTEKVYVKDKVLFIYTTNAAMKNELLYMKADIIKKINEAIEVNFVNDVLIK